MSTTVSTATNPDTVTITPEEIIPVSCDMTALIPDGEEAESAETILYFLGDSTHPIEITDPSLEGNVIIQRLAMLASARIYRLRWLLTTDQGNVLAATTTIRCER